MHTAYVDTPRMLTNSTGASVGRFRHQAFGKAHVQTEPDGDGARVAFPFRFPGQYEDAETGLHYHRHRYYSPEIGRYLAVDPIGPHARLSVNGVDTLFEKPTPTHQRTELLKKFAVAPVLCVSPAMREAALRFSSAPRLRG